MTSRTEQIRQLGQNAVTVAALALLIAYLYLQRAHIGAHYEFSLGKLLALAGLVVLTLVLRGIANRLIFARLGAIAPLRDWFAIVSVSALSSYLPASTGLVSKAHFLKRAHSVTYRQFAVGQVTLLVLSIATHGAVGLATLALWRPAAAVWIAIVFAAMSAAGSLVLLSERAAQFARGRWLPLDTATVARMRVSFPTVIALQIGVLLATACESSCRLRVKFQNPNKDLETERAFQTPCGNSPSGPSPAPFVRAHSVGDFGFGSCKQPSFFGEQAQDIAGRTRNPVPNRNSLRRGSDALALRFAASQELYPFGRYAAAEARTGVPDR